MDIKGIGELYKAGDLQAALLHSKAFVRDNPENDEGRGLLLQLYLFAGELEKAKKQLEFLEFQKKDDLPSYMTLKVISEMIDCEIQRKAFYKKASNEVPALFEEDAIFLSEAHSLITKYQAGSLTTEQAEIVTAKRPVLPMVCQLHDEEIRGELAEPDDLTAFGLEVFSARKGYAWVAWQNIASIEFHPYEKPMDLMYRRAVIKRKGDTEETAPLQAYVPAIYANTSTGDVAASMGRTTDWLSDDQSGLVTGLGQKCLLIGDQLVPLLQISVLTAVVPS
jgi:type VI secretion system protein ImpE